jgi:hypothetical protein
MPARGCAGVPTQHDDVAFGPAGIPDAVAGWDAVHHELLRASLVGFAIGVVFEVR